MSELLKRLSRAPALRSLRVRIIIVVAPLIAVGIGVGSFMASRLNGVVAIAVVELAVIGIMVSTAYAAVAYLVRPLEDLGRVAKDFAAGDLSRRASSSDTDIGRLARYLNVMVDRHKVTLSQGETANLQLHGILESLPLEIALFDAQRRYLYRKALHVVETAGSKLSVGMTAPELCLHSNLDVQHGEEIDRAVATCIETGDTVSLEQTETASNGSRRTFARVLTPVVSRGEAVVKVIGYGIDITEQRHAETALRDREQQLRQAQKMESVGRLAGGIAHDFNNLLTSIMGFTDMALLDEALTGETREDLDEVKRSALRAKDLTGQLLAYSRKQVIKPEALDVGRQVQGTEKMLRRLIGEHIELVSTYPSEPATVEMDPGQLEQVMTNLVVNARDAMPRGGGLGVEIAVVDLAESPSPGESFDPGRYVHLAIRDTGTGMDAETRSQIFEPFFTTKEIDHGTGLGLSTVYGIVSQNGGLISVDSELGLGTTINVYLPIVDDETVEANAVLDDDHLVEGRGTVLVAEDQSSVRRFVKRTLERCGYEVLVAPDGRTAVEVAREHPGSIDLLLTDIVMPGITGPEAAEMMLASRPDVRVVYMSAYPFDALGQHMVVDESVVYLEKPFEAGALAALVRDILAKSPQETAIGGMAERPSRSGVGS